MPAAGFALLFAHRMLTRYAPRAVSAAEVQAIADVLQEHATGWLRRALRPVVQSILKDGSLQARTLPPSRAPSPSVHTFVHVPCAHTLCSHPLLTPSVHTLCSHPRWT